MIKVLSRDSVSAEHVLFGFLPPGQGLVIQQIFNNA